MIHSTAGAGRGGPGRGSLSSGKKGPSSFNLRANKALLEQIIQQLENERKLRDQDRQYIQQLLLCLNEHGISPPDVSHEEDEKVNEEISPLLQDGSTKSLSQLLDSRANLRSERSPMAIHYENVSYWTMVTSQQIQTVASALSNIFFRSGPQYRVDILHSITGRIRPASMTLLMGPPGCGKSTLLKVLSGRLDVNSATDHLEGRVTYNGLTEKDKLFILAKLVSYVDELDEHIPLLTVKETLEFAWNVTTGGKHSYLVSDDPVVAALLKKDDPLLVRVWNIATLLGLKERMNTYVGDHMIRGVSGGEKRRVSIGEMLMPQGRCLSFMDAISNGLDASTTYDIMAAFKVAVKILKTTNVTSLLQPSPEVFNLFDDIILMSEGYVIFHGPREEIIPYFEGLGYYCPKSMDAADFLQDVATAEGRKFTQLPLEPSQLQSQFLQSSSSLLNTSFELNSELELTSPHSSQHLPKIPLGSKQLYEAWQASSLYSKMITTMESDLKSFQLQQPTFSSDYLTQYPFSSVFYFKQLFSRQLKLTLRDHLLLKARIFRFLILGSITSSLFHNLPVTDIHTMSGFIFYSTLTLGVGNLTLIPTLYLQKSIYYKHSISLLYPTTSYVIVQTLILLPLQLLDIIIFCTMTYWAVGLSSDEQGMKFFSYLLIMFLYHINFAQFIRLICSLIAMETLASPSIGILLMFMVLVCGYVIPKSMIPNWLLWLYWSNPFSWTMRALTVNEYSSSDYNFQICIQEGTGAGTSAGTSAGIATNESNNCTESIRFGDAVLEERGNPTDPIWVSYTLIFLFGQYLLWILLTIVALSYVKFQRPVRVSSSSTGNPMREEDEDSAAALATAARAASAGAGGGAGGGGRQEGIRVPNEDRDEEAEVGIDTCCQEEMEMSIEIPFDPITLAFQDIWYTVTLKGGEELDLLKGVSGYAEPGTMTALMGSSGAGKTTLLDVLSGRKNQGEIHGLICINGKILEKNSFHRLSGYVEQFDTLPSQSTAKEAIEFSAALRLSQTLSQEIRQAWIQSVMNTLELNTIQDQLIGTAGGSGSGSGGGGGGGGGGMSFEQRKRISIGIELVANPSLLFLDEPTTGLDSRGAGIVIRCLQRVALSGRTIVATIHQPSTSLFNSFQNLYLLRRGGETVYFGPLGENCQTLIHYFNEIPGVDPLIGSAEAGEGGEGRGGGGSGGGAAAGAGGGQKKNPATWVLECIGAGTSGSDKTAVTDFHLYYKRSVLCLTNDTHVKVLCDPVVASLARQDDDMAAAAAAATGDSCLPTGLTILSPFLSLNLFQSAATSASIATADDDNSTIYDDSVGNHEISYRDQFHLLLRRATIFYWRTPSYNFVRMIISLIVAFVFGVTCSEKQYTTDIEVVSSASVVYMTLLFLGVIQMNTVQPVAFAERPIFYREQDCNMYDVLIYSITHSLVEIPYLIISSLLFLLPFFFLMDLSQGDQAAKFFWFWLFQTLYMSSLVYCGQFMAAYFSTSAIAAIFGGLLSTSFSLFAGFLIKYETLPSFWKFMYWLNPLHYAMEGILMTQYHNDQSLISITTGGGGSMETMTTHEFLVMFFPSWSYANRIGDVLALVIIIVVLKIGTYLSLRFMRHQKR